MNIQGNVKHFCSAKNSTKLVAYSHEHFRLLLHAMMSKPIMGLSQISQISYGMLCYI